MNYSEIPNTCLFAKFFGRIDFITNEIDLSSCYEIELIKKKRDYSAMNKSGAGIGIDATTSSKAYIWLEYRFLNHDAARDALNDVL